MNTITQPSIGHDLGKVKMTEMMKTAQKIAIMKITMIVIEKKSHESIKRVEINDRDEHIADGRTGSRQK